jgi:predicted GNAT superfamily acetyltransferase
MVRHQGVDRITWTFDPLLSRNAFLNISRLGAVCNTYLRDEYGELRDGLNRGLSTDRFQVDWWVNSHRVNRRLSKRPRLKLDLAHFLAAGARIANPSQIGEDWLPRPGTLLPDELAAELEPAGDQPPIFLAEIPADFQRVKTVDVELAQTWRQQTRQLFELFFSKGYLVTDFIHMPGALPRGFYVLSYGQSML